MSASSQKMSIFGSIKLKLYTKRMVQYIRSRLYQKLKPLHLRIVGDAASSWEGLLTMTSRTSESTPTPHRDHVSQANFSEVAAAEEKGYNSEQTKNFLGPGARLAFYISQ
jgi:hypothetical protein